MNERTIDQLQKDLGALEQIRKEAKLFLFRPNRPQADMISSDATYRCLFGANKVGKSTWGIIEDVSYCIGFRPFLPPDHPRFKTPYEPPIRGMVFGETWDKMDEIHTPMFHEWIPKGWARPIKKQGYIRGWEFVAGPGRGSVIRYATYEMDSEKLEGADYNFYHFDEPPPARHWAPVTRGIITKSGKIWLTLTLLSEGWIWDEIWERADAGDPDYFAVVGRTEENTSLDAGAIARFAKTLDESEKEVRLMGRPQHLQGRIFKHFQVRPPWVIEPWDIPDEWPTIRAFDPHLSKPVACLWAKVAPNDQIIVTDELFDPKIQTMDDLRGRIEFIEERRHPNIAMSLMDSAASSPQGLGGASHFDLFRKYGINVRPAKKANKHARLMATAEGFKLDTFLEQPKIVVFDNCEHLKWEIKRYVHPTMRSGSRTDRWKEYPDGANKKDDDLIDCLQYLVGEGPRYDWLRDISAPGGFLMGEPYGSVREEWVDAVQNSSY